MSSGADSIELISEAAATGQPATLTAGCCGCVPSCGCYVFYKSTGLFGYRQCANTPEQDALQIPHYAVCDPCDNGSLSGNVGVYYDPGVSYTDCIAAHAAEFETVTKTPKRVKISLIPAVGAGDTTDPMSGYDWHGVREMITDPTLIDNAVLVCDDYGLDGLYLALTPVVVADPASGHAFTTPPASFPRPGAASSTRRTHTRLYPSITCPSTFKSA